MTENKGSVSYYNSPTCTSDFSWNVSSYSRTNIVTSGCKNTYDNSDVKKIVDNWAKGNFSNDDLVQVNRYKARILLKEDVEQLPWYQEICTWTCYYKLIYNVMNNDLVNSLKGSWVMDSYSDNSKAYQLNNYAEFSSNYFVFDYGAVTPVINLSKKALEGVDEEENNEDNNDINELGNLDKKLKYKYIANDLVVYNNENYYVLYDSDINDDYVTLVKEKPLTVDEVKRYFNGEVVGTKETYHTKDDYGTVEYIEVSYSGADIKKIVKDWGNDVFGNSLKESRLLTTDDLVDYLYYNTDRPEPTYYNYVSGTDTPDWVINDVNYSFWTMTPYEDSESLWFVENKKYGKNGSVAFGYAHKEDQENKKVYASIRPVVTINKCLISGDSDSCNDCLTKVVAIKHKNYSTFRQGEIITYHGEQFYVSRDSNKYLPYVRLVRKTPFSISELKKYGIDQQGNNIINNYVYVNDNINDEENLLQNSRPFIECRSQYISNEKERKIPYEDKFLRYFVVSPGQPYGFDGDIGGMQWYSSPNCGYYNGIQNGDCKYDYESSFVKMVIDNWIKEKFDEDEFIKINGYSYRVVNQDDKKVIDDNIPLWYMPSIYENMQINPSGYYVYSDIMKIDIDNSCRAVDVLTYVYRAVWPALIVDKCELDGGCDQVNVKVSS